MKKMSVIAQRKAEKREGAENIFFFMGLTFLILSVVIFLIVLIGKFDFLRINMTPILYFLTLSGISFGWGSFLKEHNYDLSYINNWLYSLIFIGILGGAILASIQW